MRMILLLGPTASGKSALAIALAERLPLEIVSIDSAQVYRGLDIGTAKPSAEERARVPHHLIDLVEPEDVYSAARFAADAAARIADIEARGRLPLLVGGTMLYAKALIEGLHELPPADPALRQAIEGEAASLGWPALHRRLALVDPATAARLAPHDAQRIQRALEVHGSTGRPLSDWLAEGRRQSPTGAQGVRPSTVIALEPSDRAVLHRRIETRFRTMIEQGLIEEVRRLLERPGLAPDSPAMRSVGYRQVREWLDAGTADPLERLIERGVAATRQLAKRQLTWLRSMAGRQVIDCLAKDSAGHLETMVRTAMAAEATPR
jgi:tRNA dimethylallyltransferase